PSIAGTINAFLATPCPITSERCAAITPRSPTLCRRKENHSTRRPQRARKGRGGALIPSQPWRVLSVLRAKGFFLAVLPVRLAPFGEGARAFEVVLAFEIGLNCGIGRRHRRLQGRLVEAAIDRLLRGADRHRRAFQDLRCPALRRFQRLSRG